jgi:hypothetical protein
VNPDLWLFLGPALGGLVAAGAALAVYFMVRSQDSRKANRDNLQRLRSFLLSYENEISRNIDLLNLELTETGEFIEPLSTQSRDVMLYTLGEIPLSEATDAMRYVVESYAVFDEANYMLAQIESALEHNGDARKLYARRTEFIREKLNILNWDLAQIHKIMEAIEVPSKKSDLS